VANVTPKPPTDFSNSGSALTPPNWFA
jgi:hypothetical protein